MPFSFFLADLRPSASPRCGRPGKPSPLPPRPGRRTASAPATPRTQARTCPCRVAQCAATATRYSTRAKECGLRTQARGHDLAVQLGLRLRRDAVVQISSANRPGDAVEVGVDVPDEGRPAQDLACTRHNNRLLLLCATPSPFFRSKHLPKSVLSGCVSGWVWV